MPPGIGLNPIFPLNLPLLHAGYPCANHLKPMPSRRLQETIFPLSNNLFYTLAIYALAIYALALYALPIYALTIYRWLSMR